MNNNLCRCGSLAPFSECCGFIFENDAETPEQLMRSRYVAFIYQKVDYLLRTSHKSTLTARSNREELESLCRENNFLSLKIISCKEDASDAEVQMVAYSLRGKSVSELHERSKVTKVNGKWLYAGGEVLPHYPIKKDELCWCGSEKQLKDCCLV